MKKQQPIRPLLLLFLRAPEKGRIKTRLAKTLDQNKALALYKCFVMDTLDTLKKTVIPQTLCYYPSDKLLLINQWLGKNYVYWPQEGDSLGDKMLNAFMRAFKEEYDRVVILGTDVPDLPAAIIKDAFNALASHPSVLGPSKDGGYYLLGFQAQGFLPDVFIDMPWGTDQVFERTLSVFRRKQTSVYLLPPWQDIDDKEDLEALARRDSHKQTARRTMALINTYSLF